VPRTKGVRERRKGKNKGKREEAGRNGKDHRERVKP
jgi:hypothetical protein